MKRARRKPVMIATVLVIAVIGGVASYPFWRPRNDPKVIGVLPPLTKFMPRSAFQLKPWINIPWLGGKRLQYPPPSAMPKGFVDDPAMSGIITWEEPKSAPGTPPLPFPGGLAQICPVFFNSGTWFDKEGHREELITDSNLIFGGLGTASTMFAALPYVYGDQPKVFNIQWVNFTLMFSSSGSVTPPIVSADIQLPPNHQPAPPVATSEIQVGKHRLHWTPLPRSGPGFVQKYRVEVKDRRPGETYLLKIMAPVAKMGTATVHLLLDDESPTVYSDQAAKGEKSIMLITVEREGFEVTAKQKRIPGSPGPARRQFDLLDDAGRAVAMAYDYGGRGGFVPLDAASGLIDVSITGFDRGLIEYTHGETQLDTITRVTGRPLQTNTATLKTGQKLQAFGYRKISTETGKLRLP